MSIDLIKVIIFDIDGTLTDEVSWLKLTESLGASRSRHEQIYNEFKEGKLPYTEAKAQLIKLWLSTGNANRSSLSNIFLSWKLRDDAEEIVKYLKTKYTVILISGSVDLYVETIAKKLDISDWYANTTLIWDDEREICDFDYKVDQAETKLSHLDSYLASSGYTKENCLIIGDGENDIALFEALPFGILIKGISNPVLENLSWKMINNLSELKEIL